MAEYLPLNCYYHRSELVPRLVLTFSLFSAIVSFHDAVISLDGWAPKEIALFESGFVREKKNEECFVKEEE